MVDKVLNPSDSKCLVSMIRHSEFERSVSYYLTFLQEIVGSVCACMRARIHDLIHPYL
jgi:hypothetical protein